MPRSVDLLSAVGPKKPGQSLPRWAWAARVACSANVSPSNNRTDHRMRPIQGDIKKRHRQSGLPTIMDAIAARQGPRILISPSPSGDMLSVSSRITIPDAEIDLTFVRSSGPGGQNVNKVSSKAVLRWHFATSAALPADVRARFVTRYGKRLTTEGDLLLTSQRYRDQGRNVDDVHDKLREMILSVLQARSAAGRPGRPRPRWHGGSRASRPARAPSRCAATRARNSGPGEVASEMGNGSPTPCRRPPAEIATSFCDFLPFLGQAMSDRRRERA